MPKQALPSAQGRARLEGGSRAIACSSGHQAQIVAAQGGFAMNWIIAVLTAALVVLAFLTWRVYMKMAWLSGALQTHSLVMLRMQAKEKGFKAVWWDPDLEKPPVTRTHGAQDELETIYLYLPPHQRAGWTNAGKWGRVWRWLKAEI